MLAGLVDELLAEEGEVLMAEGEQGFEMMMIEEGTAAVRQEGELINEMRAGRLLRRDGGPR